MDFSTGGWLIGGRPTGLLIWGDHLFLNYIFFFGQWWLINREGIINPHLILFHMGPLTIRESWNQKTMQKKWVPLSVCSIKQIHRTAKSHDLSSFSPFKLAILGYSPFWGRPKYLLVIHIPLIYIYIHMYTCRVCSEGRQKTCRPAAPKMGPRRSASQRNVSKGAGMPMLFCSKHARLNFDCQPQAMQRHVHSQRQCTGPWAQPPAPDIKVDFFRRKGSKTGFLGSGAIFACAYPHTSRGPQSY